MLMVIANRETLLGFKTIGFECYPADKSEEAEKALKNIYRNKKEGIILISERLAPELDEEFIKEVKSKFILTFIPDCYGSTTFASKHIRELVEKAVGIDILK